MDGGASWATVHGVAKSRIRLSDFTFTFSLKKISAVDMLANLVGCRMPVFWLLALKGQLLWPRRLTGGAVNLLCDHRSGSVVPTGVTLRPRGSFRSILS